MVAAAVLLLGAAGAGAEEFPRRNAIVLAVEKAGPGVVNISTEQITVRRGDPFFDFRDPFADNFFREYFGRFSRPREFRTHSLGSGVIIDPEGYIVTNEHVVRRASKIHLTLSDGSKYDGRLLSTDADSDLALIKVDADKPLPTVRMGRSDDLMIGETVIALGNPFGLESTVTVGVLSAKNRSVKLGGKEAYAGLIQADAAINPGNSGGALINIHGEVIGVNVAIYAEAEGIGFAIPVDRVRAVLTGLFNYRLVKKTYIGVKTRDMTPEELKQHRASRPRVGEPLSGALVTDVAEKSPAAAAGVRAGDAILGVDGKPAETTLAFLKAMLAKSVGDKVELELFREGKVRKVTVEVARVPRPSGDELASRRLGLGLQPMSRELAQSFGLREPAGLLVTAVERGGPGDEAGLQRGDVILRFGQWAIHSLEHLAILLEQLGREEVGILVVRRGRLYRARLAIR